MTDKALEKQLHEIIGKGCTALGAPGGSYWCDDCNEKVKSVLGLIKTITLPPTGREDNH